MEVLGLVVATAVAEALSGSRATWVEEVVVLKTWETRKENSKADFYTLVSADHQPSPFCIPAPSTTSPSTTLQFLWGVVVGSISGAQGHRCRPHTELKAYSGCIKGKG